MQCHTCVHASLKTYALTPSVSKSEARKSLSSCQVAQLRVTIQGAHRLSHWGQMNEREFRLRIKREEPQLYRDYRVCGVARLWACSAIWAGHPLRLFGGNSCLAVAGPALWRGKARSKIGRAHV